MWDAIADLGLEITPVNAEPPAPAARTAPATPPQAPAAKTAPNPPKPAKPIGPPSLQTKNAVSVRNADAELLVDFAPERASTAVAEGIARGWIAVGAAALVAAFAIGALFTYMRVQTILDIPAITLPPPPLLSAPTIEPALSPDAASALPEIVRIRRAPVSSLDQQ